VKALVVMHRCGGVVTCGGGKSGYVLLPIDLSYCRILPLYLGNEMKAR